MENIAKAILAVTKGIRGVEKDSNVGTGNSSYKGISEKMVKTSVKKLMIENGLSIVPISVTPNIQIDRWEEETNYGLKQKQSIFTEVSTRYLLLHTSGESIELAGYGQGVDTQDKGAGKATTYALKNTLMNTFMMITGEDSDDTHSDDIAVPQKAPNTNNKPWFNQPQFDAWIASKDKYKNADEALNIIRKKYKIGKSMEDSVRLEYTPKT